MIHRPTIRALAGTALLLAVSLAGCSSDSDTPRAEVPGGSASDLGTASGSADAERVLAPHGLDGLGTAELIDNLDRMGDGERPADLMASVRADELVIASADEELSLAIPDDRFYLSVAPYVNQTHDCFYHSLTTCTGELAATEIHVEIVDETNGKVLVDESMTTFDNGFAGFWLPRDITGTMRVSYDGKAGAADFSTDEDAPTCLTTLRLT